ncbi:MAG TPA: AraC family transcriptional regulator [Anseongella sp.]
MSLKRRDGFLGEKQINVPVSLVDKFLKNQNFLNTLYITHIGFFPKAFFHYRERKKGCPDNILFYCLDGKGYYNVLSDDFELNANQFAILPANQPHHFQADIENPWTIYWVHFSGEKLTDLNDFIDIEQYVAPVDIRYNEQIIALWEEMYFTLKESYDARSLGYANLCLYRFISLFLFSEKRVERNAEPDKMAEAIELLKMNIHKTLSVAEIAANFNYSASHFSALFKSYTGMSPMEYFIQLKIHYACQLLDQSKLKIKEVALAIGYDDAFYFSRLFHKAMGASPYDYRAAKKS